MRSVILGLNDKNEILLYIEGDRKILPELQATYSTLNFVVTEYSGRIYGKIWDPVENTLIEDPKYFQSLDDD